MKILIVNQAFFPDESATAQYCLDLCRSLCRDGHQVTVLASNRGYLDPTARYPARDTVAGASVLRVSAPALPWRFRFLRILDAFFLNVSLLFGFLRIGSFDCCICLTSPPLLGTFLGLYLPRSKGKLVHWAMDINPDQAIRAGWLQENSLLAKCLLALQLNFYKRCDAIIVLDKYMQELLQKKGVVSQRLHIIPLWWSEHIVDSDADDVLSFKKRIGVSDQVVVMYSGNHSLCHPLTAMLEAARLLREEEHITFVFAGGGSRVSEVQEFARRHELSNVVQIPHQPREDLPSLLGSADIHVVSCGDDFVGVVHPSKVYPFLALGKPFILIGKDESSVGDIVAHGASGKVVAATDGEAFAAAVCDLMGSTAGHPERLKEQYRDETVLAAFKAVLS